MFTITWINFFHIGFSSARAGDANDYFRLVNPQGRSVAMRNYAVFWGLRSVTMLQSGVNYGYGVLFSMNWEHCGLSFLCEHGVHGAKNERTVLIFYGRPREYWGSIIWYSDASFGSLGPPDYR